MRKEVLDPFKAASTTPETVVNYECVRDYRSATLARTFANFSVSGL